MLVGQRDHLLNLMETNPDDWLYLIDHSALHYFHSKYPEIFLEEAEIVDRDLKLRTVKRVRREFFGKIPLYQALRANGKIKKCAWGEAEIERQKQRQAAKGVN